MTSNLASRLEKRIDKLEDRRSPFRLGGLFYNPRHGGPSARQGESEAGEWIQLPEPKCLR